MIKFDQVSFQYPNTETAVLRDVNLTIFPGTLTLLSGASGSGKSTLLRCINGLVPHFTGGMIRGKISVFNSDPIKDGPEAMATTVGFVFQEPEAQFVYDYVEDEIAFALENLGVLTDEMHRRVRSTIGNLGLSEIQQKAVISLSGGEKQKVAIASALVCEPKVLVLDEPTSQLDPVSADEVLQYILTLKHALNLTIILSEHRLERLLPYTDSILYLTDDHRYIYGTPQEILPQMDQVPPIIEIGRMLNLKPLPLTPEAFPHQDINVQNSKPINQESEIPDETLKLSHFYVSIGSQEIIKNVDFTLFQSEIHVLLGQNGAGKTTLLRAIMGLLPHTGDKYLFGEDISADKLRTIIEHLAYLPQNPSDLLFAETVLDELKITLDNHHLQENESELISFLDQFGLAERSHRYPRDLSIGERQRTALAAITVHDPEIILMDEPTRGLDYRNKKSLSALLHRWRDQGKTILVVTHDIEFGAMIADRVTLLEAGKIQFTGSPQVAFSEMSGYKTQSAQIFPDTGWITPAQIPPLS